MYICMFEGRISVRQKLYSLQDAFCRAQGLSPWQDVKCEWISNLFHLISHTYARLPPASFSKSVVDSSRSSRIYTFWRECICTKWPLLCFIYKENIIDIRGRIIIINSETSCNFINPFNSFRSRHSF